MSLAKERAKEVALREAVKTNNLEKIRILLSSNTNPNSQDEVLIDRSPLNNIAFPFLIWTSFSLLTILVGEFGRL